MGIFLSLVALSIAFLGGLGLVLLLRRPGSSTLDLPGICGTALIFGAGLVSFSSFCLGFVIRGLPLRCAVTGICLLAGGLAWKRHKFALPAISGFRFNGLKAAAILLAAAQLGFVTWFSLYRENLDWDGLFNWESKAKAAFLNGGAIPLGYYAGSYEFFHRTYPPLVPLMESWIYGFLGRMDQSMIKLIGPYFYLAAILLLFSVANRTRSSWLLVVLPFLLVPALATGAGSASSGYADFPLSAVYLCAVVHYLECWRTHSIESARLLGISGLLLTFTKADGLVPLLCLAVGVIPLIRTARGWKLVAWAIVPGFALWMAWSALMKAFELREVAFASVPHFDRAGPLLGWTVQELTLWSNWSILWPLAAVVLLYLILGTEIEDWYPWAAIVGLPLMFYPCVYFFSTWNPVEPHVKTSITRIFVHIASAATLMVGVAFAKLINGGPEPKPMALLPATRRTAALAAAAAVTIVFSIVVYRAIQQPITHDEAWTYLNFVSAPLQRTFTTYDANNHILYTLLAKLTCHLLGPSQFALRLPSLVAGLLFLLVAGRLSRLLTVSTGLLRLFAFLALVLNPLIFDYLSIARGYSLALVGLSYAILQALALLSSPVVQTRRFVLLGLALAFSVCANLTFLFPSAALVLALGLMATARRWTARHSPTGLCVRLIGYSVLPGTLVAGLLLYLPLSHAKGNNFYFGAKTLTGSLTSFVNASFNRDSRLWVAPVISAIVVVILIAAAIWSVALLLHKKGRHYPLRDSWTFFLLLQLCIDFTLLLLGAAHGVFGVLYPEERTGMYLVVYFTLMCVSAAGACHRTGRKYCSRAAALVACVAVSLFVAQVPFTYFGPWRYDASSRRVFVTIRNLSLVHPDRKSRISCTWIYEPALEFYRQTEGAQNIEPIQYQLPTPLAGYDFYVLAGVDRARALTAGLKEVVHYDLSDTTIEVNGAQPPTPPKKR